MKSIFIAALSVILISCATKEKPNNWEKWGGPNGNFTVNEEINPNALDSIKILWTKNVGNGHGNILVADGKAYFTGWNQRVDGQDTSELSTLFCVDELTGAEIWTYDYPEKKRSFPGTRATPLIEDGKLYLMNTYGVVFCINISNGSLIWENDISNDSLQKYNEWGFTSSPVAYGDMILLNIGKNGIALHKADGSVAWQSEDGRNTWASPVLTNYKSQDAAIFLADSTVSYVNPMNGETLLQFEREVAWSIDPLVLGDKLFLGNEYYNMSGGNPELIWHHDSLSCAFQNGVVIDGYAYQIAMIKMGKMAINCVELETGKVMWSQKIRPWGAFTAANDKLVWITGKGEMSIALASSEAFTPISTAKVMDMKTYKGDFCWTNPTICNQKAFIRSNKGMVACIDLR